MVTTAPTIPAEMNVVSDNEVAERSKISSSDFLSQAPRGAYTTARTVNGDSIFELSFHIQRLATSVRLMLQADGVDKPTTSYQNVTDETLLRPKVLASIRSAIHTFRRVIDNTAELKVTVLVTWDDLGNPNISTHISPLGSRPSPPVKVQIHGAPRQNAEAKDSEWVRQRKQLENQKPADCNEVLLVGDDGALYEGLSSNFFVLIGGAIHTAGEGILLGSVRESVLRVAEEQGVPVVLQPPNLKDLDQWEAAFISSTSRLLLPIDEIQVPDADPLKVRRFEQPELAKKMEQLVFADVLKYSEPFEEVNGGYQRV